ncbi:MAG: hypothetical protein WAW17_30215, partial [Rhodococcus sp. (in: high G+C Gram-positive bacteria)]|uniref:hypothetical protein n=1 Tax=Rhodococcus sp. TaxID=1831 RepID=UPI003BB063CA
MFSFSPVVRQGLTVTPPALHFKPYAKIDIQARAKSLDAGLKTLSVNLSAGAYLLSRYGHRIEPWRCRLPV